jgi:GT2 family glycosyltransferase
MADSTPIVSILIVNWNGADYLPRCLEAVAAQTFPSFDVLLIDNASEDGSINDLERHWPFVHVKRLEHNLGFSAANNLGAHLAQGRWLALLNSDAFPHLDWLANLIEATAQYPQFSFFASRILQTIQPDRVDSTGDIYHISGSAWHRDYNQPIYKAHQEFGEVFSPCAAAALYNREAFLRAGGFEEQFFSHHEDVDLGFRLRLLGYRCLYVPTAIVEHLGSASFGRESHLVIYNGQRNLVWSYFTNMPQYLVWKYLPIHILANLIMLSYYTLRGNASSIWRAKIDALRGLPAALRKRGKVQSMRSVQAADIDQWLDHDWLSPYILGKRSAKILRLARRLGIKRS